MGESEAVRGVMTGEETCRSPDEPRGVEPGVVKLPILIRYRRLMRGKEFRAWLCGESPSNSKKNENNEHNENNNNNENNENNDNIQNIGSGTVAYAESCRSTTGVDALWVRVAETSSYGVAGQIYRNLRHLREHLDPTGLNRSAGVEAWEVISERCPGNTGRGFFEERHFQRIAVGIPSNPTKGILHRGRSGPGTTLNPKERHGG